MAGVKWTAEEDQYLLENYQQFDLDEHAKNLYKKYGSKRTKVAILQRVGKLGLRKTRSFWLPEEDQYLIDNCKCFTNKELQNQLHQLFGTKRTRYSITDRLHLLRANSNIDIPEACQHHKWLPEEEQYLIDHFAKMSCEKLAKHLNEQFNSNVTALAVANRVFRLRKKMAKIMAHH